MVEIARESRQLLARRHAAKAAAKRFEVLPVIASLQAERGFTLRSIASELNQLGNSSATRWQVVPLSRCRGCSRSLLGLVCCSLPQREV